MIQGGRPHSTNENTTSPGSHQTGSGASNTIEGLPPIDLDRRNLKFEISDFHISRRFKSFIQAIVVPDGLIHSRLERMAECIMRDYGSNC